MCADYGFVYFSLLISTLFSFVLIILADFYDRIMLVWPGFRTSLFWLDWIAVLSTMFA